MAAVTVGSVIAGIAGAVSYANSIVGEGWTRYFILIGGLFVDNQIGNFTGLYAMEGLIAWVVTNVFGIQGFVFPVYFGLSSLLVIFVIAPLVIFLVKDLISDNQ